MQNGNVTDFSHAIELLETARVARIAVLQESPNSPDVVATKRCLDDAIAVLQLCELHGIDGRVRVTQLPMPETCTPSFHYRVVADNEAQSRADWEELVVDGDPVCPSPYALLVES